jgi:hypothetical protein
MKKIKCIGFWKEFRTQGLHSVYEIIDLERLLIKNTTDIAIINHIDSGTNLDDGFRSIMYCPITGEKIGSSFIATDGEWMWTSEYIYYLKEGLIDIHIDFLKHIEINNFECQSLQKFEVDHLKKIEWLMDMPKKEMYINNQIADKVLEIFEFY